MKPLEFSSLSVRDAAVKLGSAIDKGLTGDEVSKRREKYGANKLALQEVTTGQILWRQLKSPFIYLLLGAAAVSLAMLEIIDGGMIILFVLINVGLSFYQEYKSQRTLKTLANFVVSRVNVKRQGEYKLINSSELVPGDIILVKVGDVLPADVRWVDSQGLAMDESVLTGESVPVPKQIKALSKAPEVIHQAVNIGFAGTSVANGGGTGLVFAIGKQTVSGGVSTLTTQTTHEGIFEKSLKSFSIFILRMVVITLIFVFLANLIIKGSEAGVVDFIIFSIALAVSVIPEALPVVTTFSFARGALEMAKRKVVVRRLSAIEDIGSIDVLCSDKTGTLTENHLRVAEVHAHNERETLGLAALAGESLVEHKRDANNAFDLAIMAKVGEKEARNLLAWQREQELPFDPAKRRNGVVVKKEEKRKLIIRGAWEAVLAEVDNLSVEERIEVNRWAREQGMKGRRVLAVASRVLAGGNWSAADWEKSGKLCYEGAVAFIDPVKKTTKQAIERARKLGVDVKILTGDSREVAGAVGYEIGLLASPDQVLTGEDLTLMTEMEQRRRVEEYTVFARVSPEQKFQIITWLQEKHEVGFLGEGINDAPALKVANVSLVVQGASDIAREAADIVLLDKSLEVIIDGVLKGREIFANITKYINITLASNFGNFYAVAIASLLINFLPMLPLQILLLNLLSDFPMIAIATDRVDAAELRRPRVYKIKEMVALAVIIGAISTVFDFIFFALFYRIGPGVLQTNWLIGSVLTELALIYSFRTNHFMLRTKRPGNWLAGLTGLAAIVTVALPFMKIGVEFFHFVRPTGRHVIMIIGVTLAYLVTTEIIKLYYVRFANGRKVRARAF